MQHVIMSLKKISFIVLLLSNILPSRSEELHQQKQLFEPRGPSQSQNGAMGNEQDSYMLAYHASRNQGFRPQTNHQPSGHVAQHSSMSIPHGERNYAVVAHSAHNSGERVPVEQERLLLLNQLKREQSEASARARAIANSPPVVVSNDISVGKHSPSNYIKQVQIKQVTPVSAHDKVAEQHYVNLQGQNQIPIQHYVNVQSQNQVSAPHYFNPQSQNQLSAPYYINLPSQNQVSAQGYVNFPNLLSAQHYVNLPVQNQVQHSITIPTQNQIQIQQAIDVPIHKQIQSEHLVNVPNQNQLSIQRHYPLSQSQYAIHSIKGNNMEFEKPVQMEEEKKVYVNVEKQVPVERFVGVNNHIASPSRQEVHLQAYSEEPGAILNHAYNAQRHY